jgi:cell division septal protein FtsQ
MTPPATRRYRAAAGTPRRRPRVRRASARLTPIRAGAILAMLIAAGGIYGLAATSAFGFDRLSISGNVLTPGDAIRGRIAIPHGTNLVGLATQPIVERLRDLPAVADADVTVGLPDTLRVDVHERVPILLWKVGSQRFAVDGTGLLFATVPPNPPPSVARLPTILDQRAGAAALAIRSVLEPVDLDAATRLASLTPEQIGSHADGLRVTVDDVHGFTVSSGQNGWLAVFGKYGLSQRTPTLIPGEVQLLAALLQGREDTVQTVFLSDERNGTYLPKPSTRPSSGPSPSTSP